MSILEAQTKPEVGCCDSGFGSDTTLVSEPGEPGVLLTGCVVLLPVPLSVTHKKKGERER